jgi:hypothetical protein
MGKGFLCEGRCWEEKEEGEEEGPRLPWVSVVVVVVAHGVGYDRRARAAQP